MTNMKKDWGEQIVGFDIYVVPDTIGRVFCLIWINSIYRVNVREPSGNSIIQIKHDNKEVWAGHIFVYVDGLTSDIWP